MLKRRRTSSTRLSSSHAALLLFSLRRSEKAVGLILIPSIHSARISGRTRCYDPALPCAASDPRGSPGPAVSGRVYALPGAFPVGRMETRRSMRVGDRGLWRRVLSCPWSGPLRRAPGGCRLCCRLNGGLCSRAWPECVCRECRDKQYANVVRMYVYIQP